MDVREQLLILRRSWRLITALALLGTIVAGIASMVTPTSYTASTSLFVSTQNSETSAELQQGSVFALARVQSYVDVSTKPTVLQPVIDKLGLGISPDALASKIKASTARNTVIIEIEARDGSAQRSADIANAVAASLITAVADLERPTNGTPTPVRLSPVDHATTPTEKSSPNVKLDLALGLLYGLAAGIGAAVLRHVLDRNIRTETDLRKTTGLPLLAGITEHAAGRLLGAAPSVLDGSGAEAFRKLRTNLQFAGVNRPMRSIVVTSASAGEGKSTVALNLAMTVAKGGRKVILVDADLRLPSVATATGIEGEIGLTTVLVGTSGLDESIQYWGQDGLALLASGPLPPNPSELLGSAAMSNLIEELQTKFDLIIVDSPPILPVADASVLTRSTDSVLLVVGTKKVTQHSLSKAIDQLNFVDANILGVVQNRIPRRGPDANTAYMAGYGASHPDRLPPAPDHHDDVPFRPAHVQRGKFVSAET
ncbi:capsular exopolysaccharide synthesis family protein [Arthrobacter sp. B3I9]|uniref:polysaccharide biosynthesis tyrosine autokinase n=1 Tax=Arthrobacter sp. B3I9 TaxID=3042270 RepID=UPI00278CBA4D|nr:polysaccharide biosynthesis tyrosine autokinase [Arthrobacter sp. B3I9]MDQ0848584.1 capsular exopolysaccharide synthesis family protein [Arthrobacter sp. B3I9]